MIHSQNKLHISLYIYLFNWHIHATFFQHLCWLIIQLRPRSVRLWAHLKLGTHL